MPEIVVAILRIIHRQMLHQRVEHLTVYLAVIEHRVEHVTAERAIV